MIIKKKEKKFYTSYSKLSEVKLVTIGLASAERIRQWAEKTLPNGKILGEVINANTLHHKTFKPQKGGLFCERIFGPLKDFECSCGKPFKSKKNVSINEKLIDNENIENLMDADPNKSILGNPLIKTRNFCNLCEVEYTWSVMRRYQLGYIKLVSPVSHVWYLKGNPSYLSILLDIKKRHLEHVVYCSESLTIENILKGKRSSVNSSDIVSSWNKLKEQIIYEKTIKLARGTQETNGFSIENKNELKNHLIQVKIEKRQNLKIKKQNSWKIFRTDLTKDQLIETRNLLSVNDHNTPYLAACCAKQNIDELSGMDMNNYLVFKNKYKNYFKKINIQSLLRLYTIFTQIKFSKVNNTFEYSFKENQSPKQILKNISVPSYILLKLQKNAEINEARNSGSDLLSQVWFLFSQKAIKTAFVRAKNITKKLDLKYLQKISLGDNTLNYAEIPNTSDSSSDLKNIVGSSRKHLNLIKNSVYKLSFNFLNDASKFSNVLLLNDRLKSTSLKITNDQFLLKNDMNLKFYTLSKFSSKELKWLLKNKVAYEILNYKFYSSVYKILFKNLVKIFLNILLIGNTYSTNKTDGFENLHIESAELDKFSKKLNKKYFNNALKIFYSIQEKRNNTLSHFLKQNGFFKDEWIKKGITDNQEESYLKSATNFFSLDSLKTLQLNKQQNPSKKLYNNIYSLSHRERWEGENDWDFLYYFMMPLSESEEGSIIANYKIRYNNLPEVGINSKNSDSSFNFPGISSNLQKTAFFSGPGIIQQLLREFNFYEIKKMDKQNRILLYQLNKLILSLKPNARHDRSSKKILKEAYKKRDLLIRRTKLIRKLFIKESSPESIILTILPVLPPDLRPIVKMGGQIAASDLNRLYQRVIYRNDRLKKFLKDPATCYSYEMKYAQRLLQESVDNLIQNGKSGVISEKDSRGRALKSLSDILKGKQGRFRQYLLGKRVDYSGRSVIVVGPKLKLHECGIPKEMALELYLPFLLKRILNENLSKTVVGAKTLIKTNPSLVWELLREIMQTCPVLLNRAPTLHRLGIQSFQPKLIEGRAILLHPLVCSAFNADFDGDQMAVHVPITVEARAEAWKLMLSRNNILSPATGDPLAIPSQDMVLGCYYLTTNLLNKKTLSFVNSVGSGFYYSTIKNVLRDLNLKKIDLHANIWLKWEGLIENGMDQEEPLEIRLDNFGNWREISTKNQKIYTNENKLTNQYILTTPGKVLFNDVIQKCLKV